MIKINFNKNILLKTISGLLFLTILFTTSALLPSITYAQTSNTGGQAGPTLQNLEALEASRLQGVTDPTQTTSSGASLDGVAGAAASGCIKSLLGGMFKGWVANKIGGLIGGAAGGIMGGKEVPVDDSEVRGNTDEIKTDVDADRKKEVGDGLKPSMDGIAHCLGNAVVEGILQSTINWVNSGFQGSPAFVDDPARFFTDIADYELGQFLNELSNGILCSPWDIEIRLGLLTKQTASSRRRGGCTLSDVINNVEGFVNGNFNEGGWRGWMELTQNSNNNPYGSYMNAMDELSSRINSKKSIVEAELSWNSGWLSMKDDNGKTTTPGRLIQNQVSSYMDIPAERLTFADEFDELIDALFNTLVTKLFDGLTS